jgi:hypothetical protein
MTGTCGEHVVEGGEFGIWILFQSTWFHCYPEHNNVPCRELRAVHLALDTDCAVHGLDTDCIVPDLDSGCTAPHPGLGTDYTGPDSDHTAPDLDTDYTVLGSDLGCTVPDLGLEHKTL